MKDLESGDQIMADWISVMGIKEEAIPIFLPVVQMTLELALAAPEWTVGLVRKLNEQQLERLIESSANDIGQDRRREAYRYFIERHPLEEAQLELPTV